MDAIFIRQRFVFFVIFAGLVLLLPDETKALFIPLHQSGGGQVSLPPGEIRSQFLLGGLDDILGGNLGVFDSLILTASDQGNFFFADPDKMYFDEFVRLITNGVDDRVSYVFFLPDKDVSIPGVSAFYTLIYESDLFEDVSQNGIDMQGFQIKTIALEINTFVWDSPGINPNGDGNWLDYSVDMAVTFNPEPATVLFFVSGCLFLRIPKHK